MSENLTEKAFEEFFRKPIIQEANARSMLQQLQQGELQRALIRCAFMEGARYATSRCAAEGHAKTEEKPTCVL